MTEQNLESSAGEVYILQTYKVLGSVAVIRSVHLTREGAEQEARRIIEENATSHLYVSVEGPIEVRP